ncbi:MAG: histidine--tRNA ligase family protein [Aestuariivirga sp.]|uniref:histidine--tRNA ligase n=1 Tax=Aestuariivirga sp. TaxID=2650926 RepID=UPI0025BE30E1|nr:HisS family protein [Aestuariivirga sp.]MCA3559606.1 histidine--tRNA ligase family protein [Aestuariivirga sp.]
MNKELRPRARAAKGFRDISASEIRGTRQMLATIQQVYESYGFEPVEQPFIEYTDALGKFLPDQDRPNAGVFSFQDDDGQWLSLRYDLTAPLARYVAENQQKLPTPYRSYRQGWVFRNEKPGPGRFRQFMQFDADTVGSASPVADAEVCMMAADTMEALGLERGQYVINVNNRKVIDGVMRSIGLGTNETAARKLTVMRALDKFDRLGELGVRQLLSSGRKDESGDFTPGAELNENQIDPLIELLKFGSAYDALEHGHHPNSPRKFPNPLTHPPLTWDVKAYGHAEEMQKLQASVACVNPSNRAYPWSFGMDVLGTIPVVFAMNDTLAAGVHELAEMQAILDQAGYGPDRILVDPSIIRGLEYYTGPVFECELLMETKDEDGRTVRFGSVGGGGRYDDLVARFTGQQVPATGFSIGVSRLYAALKLVGKAEESSTLAPVVVLVMDKHRQGDYWRMVQELRAGGVRAEMYAGAAGMKAQMKYADKRGAPLVVIQGGDEKLKGEVQIKDLRLGAELASNIASREEYASQRLAQFSVPEADLVVAVKKALAE